MKQFKITIASLLAVVFCLSTVKAQKIKVTEGSSAVLKNESTINIEFTYDNISVGKYEKEDDYIKAKTAEYNSKEAGRGDRWAKDWVDDRANKYEPKFTELFTLSSGMKLDKNAKYTLIIKTKFIEPGYNIAGGFGPFGAGRKNAEINAEIWIVETANRSSKVAVLELEKAPGGAAFGFDFDTGLRISEAYAISGKKLGKYLK